MLPFSNAEPQIIEVSGSHTIPETPKLTRAVHFWTAKLSKMGGGAHKYKKLITIYVEGGMVTT